MAVLDKVMEMQKQGMQDTEITKKLADEGAPPKEINDALNQAKVKTAVSQDPFAAPQQMQPQPAAQAPMPEPQPPAGPPVTQEIAGMEQSIMQPGEMPPAEAPQAQPEQPQPAAPAEGVPAPAEEAYYPETPQAYPQQAYYAEQAAITADTVTEIAEQIVSEKFQEFQEKTGDIAIFKTNVNEKIKDLDERLKRIEDSIEKLQQAVIGKIGEFGETSSAIHKDLDNLHNTVSKLMNPLIDNYKELKKLAKGTKAKTSQ